MNLQAPYPPLQTQTLTNGQLLAWRQWGDPRGHPVLYCHGFPACSLEAGLAHEAAMQHRLCIIAPDRPGYGGSPYQPERTLAHWPETAALLMDALGHEHFAVAGFSGGGPYAAETAAMLRDRVQALLLAAPVHHLGEQTLDAGMAHSARALIWLSQHHPRWAERFYRYALGPLMFHWPVLALRILMAVAPPADQAVRALPAFMQLARASTRQAFVQGGRGAARDLWIYTHLDASHWDHISCPVSLWHGLADRTVPAAASRAWLKQGWQAETHWLEDEGHFSLVVRHMPAMLASLRKAINA